MDVRNEYQRGWPNQKASSRLLRIATPLFYAGRFKLQTKQHSRASSEMFHLHMLRLHNERHVHPLMTQL